ncbi:MAG: ribosome-associated translation inhibitor RaiA [Gemmatimonadota bacterium]|nr:ribosome-associated translation inhibitor RaiA [Gemmatimonadota bacterium]MDH3427518.1 ribosome-associated translation inhibitor RaiA [Gemmatimonadota bacterium]
MIISARHIDLPEDVRDHIESQFQRLTRFEPRVSRSEVTLREEGAACVVEAVLSIDGGAPVHGAAEAEVFRSAIDRLTDKLTKQLKRIRSRRTDHRGPIPEIRPMPGEEDA